MTPQPWAQEIDHRQDPPVPGKRLVCANESSTYYGDVVAEFSRAEDATAVLKMLNERVSFDEQKQLIEDAYKCAWGVRDTTDPELWEAGARIVAHQISKMEAQTK